MSEIIQTYIVYIFQLIIAFGLINVWIIRFNKQTKYRGSGAINMQNEFAIYGLPVWFMYLVGMAKIIIAILMIVGFWLPSIIYPASIFLAILMIGAISMHVKVKDPFIRTLPAICMFLMAFINIVLIKLI